MIIERILRTLVLAAAISGGGAGIAVALQAAGELLVPAAARSSAWMTDLVIMNPEDAATRVSVFWLERGRENVTGPVVAFTLQPRQSVVLEDVLASSFHLERGEGAFRVVAETGRVVVTSRIYSRRPGAGTVGQGFEGIPAVMAIGPAAHTNRTWVPGVVNTARFRSTFYALALADGATLRVILRDAEGQELAREVYGPLGAYQPMLVGLGDLDPELPRFELGTLDVTVTAGSAVVGASKVDNNPASNDPTTLEAWLPCVPDGSAVEVVPAGSYAGIVANENGFLGGIVLGMNADREVVSLEFSYPSDLCGATFGGNVSFRIPVPLEDFAEGVTFGPSTFTVPGQLVWTVTMEPVIQDLYLEGTLTATGEGFSGAYADCNGDHPADRIRLGKEQQP